jgi:signal transduction histidine kinase
LPLMLDSCMKRFLSGPYKVCQAASGGRWSWANLPAPAAVDSIRPRRRTVNLLIAVGCALLIAAIGYADFREGDENTMLLFYMLPIALATWYGGIALGVVMVLLSTIADYISDRVAGVTTAGTWNTATSFFYYLVFAVLLSRWHNLLNHMQVRVEERTADLRREIGVRKELEREVANVTERERRRLGRQLHDDLCQHLTGTALKAQTVVKQLQQGDGRTAENARGVVDLLNRGIEIARDIGRGLFSSELEGDGLILALGALADSTSQEHHIDCTFHHDAEVTTSADKATHLYWIAQEAVTNAVRHANAKRIEIELTRAGDCIELSVGDDGVGLGGSSGEQNGVGLQVMRHRAQLAGGFLMTSGAEPHGTNIRCEIPVHS